MPRLKKERNIEADLRAELNDLKIRLNETEDTLSAIRNGEVDAIVLSGERGEQIFSLTSSETPYRIIIEQMDEGTVTIASSGIILYCNQRFSEILEHPLEKLVGSVFSDYISDRDSIEFSRLLQESSKRSVRGELALKTSGKTIRLSLTPLPSYIDGDVCIIVSDITEITSYQNYLREMVEERTNELKIANQHLNADLEKLRAAEKALQESEKMFRSAFDEGAVPMTLTSHDGRFLKVNRTFCKLTGYTEAELLQMNFQEITYPGDLELSLKGREELENNERSFFSIEKRYVRKDGKTVWVSISSAPVMDENGNWDCYVNHIQDINKRKNAENRLKESREKFRQLANSIPQLAWIARSDGKIIWFNHRWYEYTGKGSEEMTGNGWYSVLHPDSARTVDEKWRLFVDSEKPFEMINRILGKDGIYREFLTKSIPIKTRNGKIDQWFGTHTDISELKKVEHELMKSQKKLNIALENGQIGTWEWDLSTNLLIWDERTERMFGLEPGTFAKTYNAFESLVHEEDLPHLRDAIRQAIKAGTHFETIYRTRPQNGTEPNYISSKALVNTDDYGRVTSMSGVCFDVTGMKKGAEQALIKLNEELLRSNTDLQQFAYVASHDLQEPLRMVSSFTQLLQHRFADKLGVDGEEYIRYAVEGSKRMYQLLNGLLAYSRIQTRGREFSCVDMNRVVEKVTENLKLVIGETGTVINCPGLPQIMADENQMMQLFQNLFENSIKFSRGTPVINVSYEIKKELYVFSVNDNGIGIEPQYYERIFRIFQRLHRSDEYDGTGIGLAICKRIIERHGGKIWVESEFGEYTTFSFSLPVIPQNPSLS